MHGLGLSIQALWFMVMIGDPDFRV